MTSRILNQTHDASRILLVEDDALVARTLSEALSHLGYKVCGHAYSGIGAVLMAERLKPDLVAMDIHLSGDVDGIEAAERMQANWDIPVLFISGRADAKTRLRAEAIGGFVPKPYTEAELSAGLKAAMERHHGPS